jgi:hypothetical protein
MPSKPSRADEELARQATDAGYPTSADQVRELHERRVLPEKVVVRRGHGITESRYPKGTLDVLVAVRREMAKPDRGMIRRAVLFAWVNGANVRSDALLDGLLRMADDGPRALRRRPHRAGEARHGAEPLVPDPRDRQEILQTVAELLVGEPPPVGRARSAAAHVLGIMRQIGPAMTGGRNLPVPAGGSASLAAAMTGGPGEGDAALDLSVTSIRATFAYLLPNRRRTLDRLRDRLRTAYAGRLSDAELLGMIIGQAHQVLAGRRRT